MSDKDKAEELLQQSAEQKRHQTEPSDSSDDRVHLEDAIRDAYEQLDDGEVHENLSIRDRDLAALFEGMDAAEDLPEVGTHTAVALDREESPTSKGGVLALLVRVGLREVAPARVESAKEAKRDYLASQADEF